MSALKAGAQAVGKSGPVQRGAAMMPATLERTRRESRWAVLVLGMALVAGPIAATAPFLLAATLLGGLLLAAVFVRPLLVLGVVLLLGPMDLSFLTGGMRGLFASLGGLDMNGIRIIGVSFGLGVLALVLPRTRAVMLGPWGLAYAGFVAWSGFALLRSPNFVDGARLWLHIAYPLLVFVTIVGLADSRQQLDRLLDFALAGAALIVFVLNPIFTAAGGWEVQHTGHIRIRGVGTHENPISFYLLASLYIAFTRLLLRRQWRYLVLTAGIALWLVLTLSRITFAAALVGLGIIGLYALVRMRDRRVLLATAVAMTALGLALVPVVIDRTFGFVATPAELLALLRSPAALYESINWQGRELVWPVIFAAFLGEPWIGHGLGSSAVLMRQYFPPEVTYLVHNDYLRFAVETGVVGVLLFSVAMASWLRVVLRADRIPAGAAREYALPALAALFSWGTIAITDNPMNVAPFTQSVALLVGASAACLRLSRKEGPA
jgi:O-antigen ligase